MILLIMYKAPVILYTHYIMCIHHKYSKRNRLHAINRLWTYVATSSILFISVHIYHTISHKRVTYHTLQSHSISMHRYPLWNYERISIIQYTVAFLNLSWRLRLQPFYKGQSVEAFNSDTRHLFDKVGSWRYCGNITVRCGTRETPLTQPDWLQTWRWQTRSTNHMEKKSFQRCRKEETLRFIISGVRLHQSLCRLK